MILEMLWWRFMFAETRIPQKRKRCWKVTWKTIKVGLTVEVFKVKSIRKVLVTEAKSNSASVIVVGITKHTALGGWASVAKYFAKRLPPLTEVMAVHDGRIVFSRFSTHQLQGPSKDPKQSFYSTDGLVSKDNQS